MLAWKISASFDKEMCHNPNCASNLFFQKKKTQKKTNLGGQSSGQPPLRPPVTQGMQQNAHICRFQKLNLKFQCDKRVSFSIHKTNGKTLQIMHRSGVQPSERLAPLGI